MFVSDRRRRTEMEENMKIVVAMDSFKGSLDSLALGQCIKENILQVDPEIEVVVKGIADGGEGTVMVLGKALGAKFFQRRVHDAYGQWTDCTYAILEEEKLAIIEVAEIVGITKTSRREPLKASTYGIGEIILACISQGIRHFIIGLGGSATNDGGIGMMEALGLKATYKHKVFNPMEIETIDFSEIEPLLKECSFVIASDVQNPLCGPQGATAIFGPQKGVDARLVPCLDQALFHYANLVSEALHLDLRNVSGAGAAGGLGFAFMSFMHASIQSGVELVIERSNIEQEIAKADLVITGEGCIDGQTAMGKAPAGIGNIAKKYGVPVIALGGSVKPQAEALHEQGITAYFSIQTSPMTLTEAMKEEMTKKQLGLTIQELIRLIKSYSKISKSCIIK